MDEEIVIPQEPVAQVETALPQQNLSLKRTVEDLIPNIEKIETEDEKIAQLHNQVGWEALRDRIRRKIEAVEESTKITSNTVGLVTDVQLYGFKCMARDILVEAYKSIIDDVDNTFAVLQAKKDEQSQE